MPDALTSHTPQTREDALAEDVGLQADVRAVKNTLQVIKTLTAVNILDVVSDEEYFEDAAQPSEDVSRERFILVKHFKQHVLDETDGIVRLAGECLEMDAELRAAGVSLAALAWSELTALRFAPLTYLQRPLEQMDLAEMRMLWEELNVYNKHVIAAKAKVVGIHEQLLAAQWRLQKQSRVETPQHREPTQMFRHIAEMQSEPLGSSRNKERHPPEVVQQTISLLVSVLNATITRVNEAQQREAARLHSEHAALTERCKDPEQHPEMLAGLKQRRGAALSAAAGRPINGRGEACLFL